MSTTRQIAHNTIVQIAGKAVSTVFGVVALLMLTHYLGTEKFGWYTTTISFLGFVGILIDFGLIPVTAQMLGEGKIEEKKLLKNLLAFRLLSAVIFFILAPLVAMFFPYPAPVKFAIALSAVGFVGNAANQIFIGYFQAKLKMHLQAIGEICGRAILVLGLWLFIFKQADFIPIMLVIVTGSLAYSGILFFMAEKNGAVGLAFEWDVWKSIITKSWPIAVAIMFNVVYIKGDILILAHFFPQSEVGIYGAAYRVIEILAQMAMMMMGILLPILTFHWTRQQLPEFKKYFQQSFDLMMLFAVPVLAGTIMTADRLTPYLGESFAASAAPLKILALALFGVYLGAVFGHTAVALDKQRQVMWIYITNAIITLTGYLIFIPIYGMYGAAWMTVFSEVYAGGMLFFAVKKFSGVSLQAQTFAKIIFASLVMSASIYLLTFLPILWLIFIGAVIYIGMILSLGIVSKETLKEITSFKKT